MQLNHGDTMLCDGGRQLDRRRPARALRVDERVRRALRTPQSTPTSTTEVKARKPNGQSAH
jgi:hypothetical protein